MAGYIPTLIVFRTRVRSAFLWTYPLTGSALQSDEFYNPNPTVDNDSNTFSHAHQPTGWAWVNPQLMIFDDAVQTDCITEGEGGHKKKEQSPFSIHVKTGFVPADIKFFLPRFCCRGI